MNNSRFFWILDNGHGGVVDNIYQTNGKRSPKWPNGQQLFEGVFNREMVHILSKILQHELVDCAILVPELQDISLVERVRRVNELCKTHKNAILVSIHANAGGGSGFEVFTSVGESFSDKVAKVFCDQIEKSFPHFNLRKDETDGDPDKEMPFYVLRKTKCPAILTENLFMDTYGDCQFLLDPKGVLEIAVAHAKAILECERRLL